MVRALLAPLLLLTLTGCAAASASAPRQASLVVAEPPAGHCTALGTMAFKSSGELLMSQDALFASAVYALQGRAAQRGATHLVLDPSGSPAMVAWSNTARASGHAYRCDDPTR